MGRGVKGRGRQDKRVWRQRALQPSLHIPLTRLASSSWRVVKLAQTTEIYCEFVAPSLRKGSSYQRLAAS